MTDHREAVDLELARVSLRGDGRACGPSAAPMNPALRVSRRCRAKTRGADAAPGRTGPHRSPDPLGRGVRSDQERVLFLESHQLPQHQVVLGIGDLRLVEDVVAVAVIAKLLAQLLDSSAPLGALEPAPSSGGRPAAGSTTGSRSIRPCVATRMRTSRSIGTSRRSTGAPDIGNVVRGEALDELECQSGVSNVVDRSRPSRR